MLTNDFNLPEVFVKLAERNTYSRGKSDRSITQLIDSPRKVNLSIRYKDSTKQDVSDMIWPLLGTVIHEILEHAGEALDDRYMVEERIFHKFTSVHTVGTWTVSGAVDLQIQQDDGTIEIQDYKFTSVYSVMNEKQEWVNQLNAYGWLIRHAKGVQVSSMKIIGILKDWRDSQVGKQDGYPPAAVATVDIPVWSNEEQDRYMEECISAHMQAAFHAAMDEDMLAPCTDEQRWMRPTTYAVMKNKNKRAHKVMENREEALALAEELTDERNTYRVEERIGEPIRCLRFCDAAENCAQHKESSSMRQARTHSYRVSM
jgi:hypothetical protein